MYFLDAINIVALLFYSQKKEEEKLILKQKFVGGSYKKLCKMQDGQKKNKINREFCFAVKLPKNENGM